MGEADGRITTQLHDLADLPRKLRLAQVCGSDGVVIHLPADIARDLARVVEAGLDAAAVSRAFASVNAQTTAALLELHRIQSQNQADARRNIAVVFWFVLGVPVAAALQVAFS